jgi:hypothetical protein
MATQFRRGKTRLGLPALLVLLATLSATAQEKRDLPPPAKARANPTPIDVITLGTTKERADSFLGAPQMGAFIPSLGRSTFTYKDGTQIIFVCGRAISVTPGGLAEGDPAAGYTVVHERRQVLFEPIVLRGVPLDGPLGATKWQVEDCFYFAAQDYAVPPCCFPPPYVPPTTGKCAGNGCR